MPDLPKTPSFRLDGRRALVTGASRGIGFAAAAALADAGAHVTLVARDAAALDGAVAAITDAGGAAEALPLDVCDVDAVQQTIGRRPAFDVLVNNAGANRVAPFTEVKVADFDAVMGLNLRAAFFVAQAVARSMLAAMTAGSIINVSSHMALVGVERRTVYCASKAAIEGLTRAMALDLAPHGIRVNTLCPTFVETAMSGPALQQDGGRDRIIRRIKLGRVGRVEDLMGAVLLLAGDASAMMTGSALVVDGGWTAD